MPLAGAAELDCRSCGRDSPRAEAPPACKKSRRVKPSQVRCLKPVKRSMVWPSAKVPVLARIAAAVIHESLGPCLFPPLILSPCVWYTRPADGVSCGKDCVRGPRRKTNDQFCIGNG